MLELCKTETMATISHGDGSLKSLSDSLEKITQTIDVRTRSREYSNNIDYHEFSCRFNKDYIALLTQVHT